MISNVRKMGNIATVAAVLVCLGAGQRLAAQDTTGPMNVFYTASGTFASTPVSGADLLFLSGQPFSLAIVAMSSTKPTKNGPTFAKYNNVSMVGTVFSALVPGLPLCINSVNASVELATNNPSYDVLSVYIPTYVGLIAEELYISSTIQLPKGTLTSLQIRPFANPGTPINLSNSTQFSYSNQTATTVLGITPGKGTIVGN